MNYYVPDRNLEPPEDTRKKVYRCALCGEDILEGDPYYDLGDIVDGPGKFCESCIGDFRRSEAELDY